ncbi:NmrA-like family domain-containing protein [Lachnellula suecica]|uniref:NmrA-like family domain-containing protein n=1 Tax=Lachnellula suecica TaxID=602035 RepID=A0A8T9CGX4_9HELO|nr:NmrA-like family domain-containing protein [Lachnellula suecica]
MSSPKTTLLILGGAGAQNSAVAKVFSSTNTYSVRLLTRSLSSPHAAELALLPNITLIEGDCYDDDTLVSAFEGVDLVFINTNGFAVGEKNELYWGIRMYEIARWAGVKHFLYSGLPYVSKNGGFDPSRRVPFVDGKGKVAQYLAAMPITPMPWSVLATGPYAERLWEPMNAPVKEADGTFVFRLPLGETGAMPLVALDEIGLYAQWMFEHPKLSAGLHLGVAIAHISGSDIAAAFETVTGNKARKNWNSGLAGLRGSNIENGGGAFWALVADFRESAGNTGLWSRDYALLDEVMPGRIKTLEEWMRKVKYDGKPNPVLKTGLSLN